MSLKFAVEPLAGCWNEVIALATEHWKETEGYRHNQPFRPSFERYNQYDQAGWLAQFTVRDAGVMVGYATMYFTPSMHTQQLIATEDTWFLLPAYRKGRNAIEFYKFIEAECRRRGVVEIGVTAKHGNGAGRIIEYLGFQEVSRQFSKHLSYNEASLRQGTTSREVRADSAMSEQLMEPPDVRTLASSAT